MIGIEKCWCFVVRIERGSLIKMLKNTIIRWAMNEGGC
jgi:hypothetical protein